MFLAVILSNGCYLMKIAILKRKHTIFFTSPDKNLSIPNKKIGKKLPSHSYRSASWLAWYRITKGSKLEEDNMLLVSMLWDMYTVLPTNSKSIVSKGI